LKTLAGRWAAVLGRGDNLLNIIYAADVAEGVIRAANHPGAVGRAYNLSSEGEVTQRWFLDLLTDTFGVPPVRLRVPYRLALWLAFLGEAAFRAFRSPRPPHLSRYAVSLIGRSTRFSIERAKTELGWRPQVGVAEGFRRALDWYAGVVGRPVKELLATVR
jgi:nucleoside-diphosphate-sugar epimerase